MYRKYIKRPLDILFSSLALIVFCWLYPIVAILVRIKLGSPVIFKQQRPGKDEKIFTLYKFRTMTDMRDEDGNLLPDSERLTKFGKFLRSTSLDELPEAWNILKGNMSAVGPRPLLTEYLPVYSEEERRRHEVRPGMTGLAQVEGRNALEWHERFALDLQYVDNVRFCTDIQLIFKTFLIVMSRRNSIVSGEVILLENGQIIRSLHIERNTYDQNKSNLCKANHKDV